MNKILVTGGAGFIGSHVAEYFANKGKEVTVVDNFSRGELLGKEIKGQEVNWNILGKFSNIKKHKQDIVDFEKLNQLMEGQDVVIHTAAQTAVTTSIINPHNDFRNNVLGTFNVLESARKNDVKNIVFCSTNKVYGENVNKVEVVEGDKRYSFNGIDGIKEEFSIDQCEHTPYGCSKLTGDLYSQDYARLYGLKAGVFRMSCIYGTRQFGVEDQGWVAWFTIATLMNKPITIYGDGKQVRDVLYVEDLIKGYEAFLDSTLKHGVFNIGGGKEHTISLIELLDLLEEITGKKPVVSYSKWRNSDQKVFISDVSKMKDQLNWEPSTKVSEGLTSLVDWVEKNKDLF
jgi:CDP-paratose 2-epimerase